MMTSANPTHQDPSAPADMQGNAMSGLMIANVLLRHRRMIVLIALAMGAWTFYKSYTSGRTWTSTGSFSPGGQSAPSAASGLAAQLGLGGGSDGAYSQAFYQDLIPSRAIMGLVAERPLTVRRDGRVQTMTIAQWYGLGDPKQPAVRHALLNTVRSAIAVSTSPTSGIMHIVATTSDPEVSRQLAQHTLDAVVAFNAQHRRERMQTEREFIETLAAEYYERLQAAARRFQRFQQENREYRASPQLAFEADRLQADVIWQQELYNSVTRTYEQLRVDAMRETPAIRVFEKPLTPVAPNARGTIKKSISSGILGLILGGFLAFLIEFLIRSATVHPSAIEEFRTLRRDALNDLRLRSFRRS